MKLLIVGGLLTVGIILVGSLTIGLMQDKGPEQTEVVQSASDVASLQGNQDQSSTDEQKVIDNLVVQDRSLSTSKSNVIDDAIIKVSLYGNKDQSGTRVHQAVNDLLLQGTPVKAAILNVINSALANEGANLLSSAALNTTKNHKPTVLAFMTNMVAANDLFPATKLSIENKPEDVLNIINAGVVLYPDFAQEVINAAVMTGEIDPNEALLAAIAAGADPTTVSQATAAGGNVAGAGQPFNGLGGGGAGNDTLSASNN
ncbi:hypothetical protein [Paraglaciecola sp. 25GB23A]|uniref:hypothetical protein n=1 Tax=Paraglaciecola sp. 25GB23A TaxID=3156068 RepID=UPI0032AE9F0A